MNGFSLGHACGWMPQVERPKWQIHIVAPHIAKRTVAKIPPTTPLRGMVATRAKRPLGCWAKPEVPVQRCRWLFALCGTLATTPALASPDMTRRHVSNGARVDDLNHAPVVFFSVDLRPHLRDNTSLLGFLSHQSCLGHRVR